MDRRTQEKPLSLRQRKNTEPPAVLQTGAGNRAENDGRAKQDRLEQDEPCPQRGHGR